MCQPAGSVRLAKGVVNNDEDKEAVRILELEFGFSEAMLG